MRGDDVTDDVFDSRTIDILMRAGGRPFCTEVIGYAKGLPHAAGRADGHRHRLSRTLRKGCRAHGRKR